MNLRDSLSHVETNPESAIAREADSLRARCPWVRMLRGRVGAWTEGAARRFSACLDIRLDQTQLLVCGGARPDAETAIHAAFAQAGRRLKVIARLQQRKKLAPRTGDE